uniref:Uncharacterized protein n=1 Tax=Romanomermis culicivorax TaxID=13658 RepID=A0A915J8P2_ROMCU
MFPEHHWMDYPDALKEEIQRILLPQPTPAFRAPQIAEPAPVIAQAGVQPPTTLPLPPVSQPLLPAPLSWQMASMDVQTLQAPSTSVPALIRHGQLIQRPGGYEDSRKRKQNQQEEVDYRKSHKTHMTYELQTQRTPPPSTSHTERSKTPNERTIHHHEQCTQQKARETAGQIGSQTGATLQPKVTTTKTAVPAKQTPPASQLTTLYYAGVASLSASY